MVPFAGSLLRIFVSVLMRLWLIAFFSCDVCVQIWYRLKLVSYNMLGNGPSTFLGKVCEGLLLILIWQNSIDYIFNVKNEKYLLHSATCLLFLYSILLCRFIFHLVSCSICMKTLLYLIFIIVQVCL